MSSSDEKRTEEQKEPDDLTLEEEQSEAVKGGVQEVHYAGENGAVTIKSAYRKTPVLPQDPG